MIRHYTRKIAVQILAVSLFFSWVFAATAEGPVSLKWRYQSQGDMDSSPVIGSSGTIYIGSDDENLHAVRPDGTRLWKKPAVDHVRGKAAIGAEGSVYFTSISGYVYAVAPTGTLDWFHVTDEMQEAAYSPALGEDGTLYVGSDNHSLIALNPGGSTKWTFETGERVKGSAGVGQDGTLYVGSFDSHLYALTADGKLKWRYRAGNRIWYGAPAVDADGTVYFSSEDGAVYALNPSGTLKWKFDTGGAIYTAPVLGPDDVIYFGSFDRHIYAVNRDGTLKWKYKTGSSVFAAPAVDQEGTAYCGSYDSYIYAITDSGDLKWRYKTGDAIRSTPAIGLDGTTIYCGSMDNYLYALSQTHFYVVPVFKPLPGNVSGLAVTNLNTSGSADISTVTYSQTGIQQTVETRTIPSAGQDSIVVGLEAKDPGWIAITSTQPLAGLSFFGRYENTSSSRFFMADVPFTKRLSTSFTIPHAAMDSTWDMALFPANPNTESATLTVVYRNKNGTASPKRLFSIAANGSREIPIKDIATSTELNGGSITVSSTVEISLFALYENVKTGNLSFAGITDDDTASIASPATYYLPVFKTLPDHVSGLALTNLSYSSGAAIQVSIFNTSGARLYQTDVDLPLRGQDALVMGTELGQDGWIQVTTDQPLAGLNFLATYPADDTNRFFMADVPFIKRTSTDLLIPHVAQDTSWDTTVYITGSGDSQTTATLTYVAPDGTGYPPLTVTVPAFGSREIPMTAVAGSSRLEGGYLLLTSQDGIAAFALYSNLKSGGLGYAGINAVDLTRY